MASAFGGQRSIQLSYGCLIRSIDASVHRCKGASGEEIVGKLQGLYEGVNLLGRVVHRKRRARRGGDAKVVHQRPRTVLACSDRDALLVENGRDVMGMGALHRE